MRRAAETLAHRRLMLLYLLRCLKRRQRPMLGPTHVQHWGGGSTSAVASFQTGAGITTTTGNCLIVAVALAVSSGTVPATVALTDTAGGNTYTQSADGYVDASTKTSLSAWTAPNITGGASFKITATPSASCFITIGCMEVSGAHATTPVFSHNHGTGVSAAPASGNCTSTGNNDLCWAATQNTAFPGPTCTAGSGFTIGFETHAANTTPLGTEFEQSINSTTNPGFTLGSSQTWSCIGLMIQGLTSGLPNKILSVRAMDMY